jgi:hypothetical protein
LLAILIVILKIIIVKITFHFSRLLISKREIKSLNKVTMASEMTIPKVVSVGLESLKDQDFGSLESWIKANPNHLYIGNKNKVEGTFDSKWANPHRGPDAMEKYREMVLDSTKLNNSLKELSGKVLGAFGSGRRNHGLILVELFCEQFNLTRPDDTELVREVAETNKMNFTILVNGKEASNAEAYALLNMLAGTYKPRTSGPKSSNDGGFDRKNKTKESKPKSKKLIRTKRSDSDDE